MNQQYFVVEFAHCMHGRIKRIQISYKSIAYIFGTAVLFSLLVFGLASSYLRMSWKVSHYNELRADFERLRTRYQELQRISRQHNEQMASLASLASEVSVAYGIRGKESLNAGEAEADIKESIGEYNFLKSATYSNIYHHYAYSWHAHSVPSLWPVDGQIRSSFGGRTDPFSGEGAFHTGVDLAAPPGTPVHVTADGVVVTAGWAGAYGKLVVVDHGNGLETYYAHLSQYTVVPGQEVLRGQVIALTGGTGRTTGPHIHYEVRVGGTPINPYRYLSRPKLIQASAPVRSDLGL